MSGSFRSNPRAGTPPTPLATMGKKDETPEERLVRKEKEKKGTTSRGFDRNHRAASDTKRCGHTFKPASVTRSIHRAVSRSHAVVLTRTHPTSLSWSWLPVCAEKKSDKKDKAKDTSDETPEERASRKAKKEAKKAAEDAKSARPAARGPPEARAVPNLKAGKDTKGKCKPTTGGYMDDMDLPSSDDDEGELETIERDTKTIVLGGKTDKEEKKTRAKELEAARKEGAGLSQSPHTASLIVHTRR